jgi:hypothetical protein
MEIKKVSYPHLNRILNLYPGPQVLLGKEIYWTVKEDGSNIGVYKHPLKDELAYRSRNQERASQEFYKEMDGTPEHDRLLELVLDAAAWGDEYVIFGELCQKGKSPTRIETHEETHFTVFDIWSERQQSLMNFIQMFQQCQHFDLPRVNLLGRSNSMTLEGLYSCKDYYLDMCKDIGKEGTVGKVWGKELRTSEGLVGSGGILYFKEKLDLPRLEKFPRIAQEGVLNLPNLSDSEIYGAIDKAKVDLGEDFRNPKIAMPLIADYVKEECRAHLCRLAKGKALYAYYQDVLGTA